MALALLSDVAGRPLKRSGTSAGPLPADVCARRPIWPMPVFAALLVAVWCALAPSVAAADTCPSQVDTSYTGNCGPWFAVPNWTDAGGWDDPAKYATIQLADVNGDGSDELIGRADDGVEIFWFDTTFGQWRPQVDSNGNRQALTDFATPPPWEASDPHSPAQPQYYSTVQAADIDGQPGAEILARFWDGMRAYKYTPPQGKQIDGGSWAKIGTGGPFSDSDGYGEPSLYLTIKAADMDGDGKAELVSRTSAGVAVYGWTGSGWATDGPQVTDPLFGGDCADAPCYYAFQPFAALAGPGLTGYGNWLLTRPGGRAPANQQGVQILRKSFGGGFAEAQPFARSPQDPWAGPFNSQSGWSDCVPGAGNTECFDQSPSYYETLRAADIDGQPGDELLGRLDDGLHVKRHDPYAPNPFTIDDAEQRPSWSWYGAWKHESNVPGAIDGTETSSTGSNAIFQWSDAADDYVQIIGPKGPDLGTFSLTRLDPGGGTYTISQYAPQRTEQQVLWTGVTTGHVALRITPESGTTVIDAFRTGTFDGQWSSLATLDVLSGIGSALNAQNLNGFWGSIRTGDIDGDGKDEVLHLFGEGNGLLAWSYDPRSNAWSTLPADPPLALGDEPWLSHPEYYSTIQVGDVDGDGRDDVIARGPSGIRTWFYDRRGSGGWERYLPEGYPAFTGRQQAAYEALNALAHSERGIPETAASVRDVWVSENDPQILSSQLATLLGTGSGGLGTIAGCSGLQPGNPPQYQTCTPPFGEPQRTFTVLDWTAVVNELLSEIYAASQVVAFFGDLGSMREFLLMQEGAELPDIGHELGLQAAAGSTALFDFHKFLATTFGIAGAAAGAASPAAGAPLSIAAYVLSALPSGSPTANSKFETTYAGLQHQFDNMVGEVTASMNTQSQEVRQDAGLLGLVSQLVSSGTWQFDTYGMQSAGSQGFAYWLYQSLLPTISDRYKVTNCYDGYVYASQCSGVPPNPTAIGNPNDLDAAGGMKTFIYPGQVFDQGSGVPCSDNPDGIVRHQCIYYAVSPDIIARGFGSLPAGCIYKPRHPETMWTSDCPIGNDVNMSIGRNTWGFNSYCGNFVAKSCSGAAVASAAGARRGAPIVLGRPRHGRRRATRGRARFRAEIDVPRGLRLAGATVGLKRLLFEPRGRGELTRPRGSRAPRLKLRRTGPGRFSAAARSGRPRARIVLRRIGRRRALLTLTAGARAFRAPRACHALPASVALETPRLELETRLVIRNGRARRRIVVPHHMRCRRDAAGNIDRLVYIRNRPHRLRPGLAVTLRGPRRVRPGTTARYVVRVHNRRRRGDDRLVSSLWDVTLTGGGRTTRTRRLRSGPSRRIRELRAGRTRRLAFTIRVPRAAHGRLCADAVAAAPGARADRARACSLVQAARGAPKVTG
jgi:hypothetical protein